MDIHVIKSQKNLLNRFFSTSRGFAKRLLGSYFVVYLKNHPLHSFGTICVAFALLLAVFGPMIVPHSPTESVRGMYLKPPSAIYWFGTDANGMDVFSRCIAAFRTDVAIAFTGAILSLIIGAPAGVFAGYFDGRKGFYGIMSMLIMRSEDVLLAFPVFVLGLLTVAALGPGPINVILAIVLVNHLTNLRLARSEILSLRDQTFVEAAKASGNSDMRIAFLHLMPNAMTPVIANISMVIGFGILLTAGLSFIGAGVEVPTPEWGSMISVGAPSMITGQWWPALFPGIVMAITIFAFSMLGEAATHLLDPLERVRIGFR